MDEVKIAVKSRWTKLKYMLANDRALEYIKRYPISSNDLAKERGQVEKFMKAEKWDNVQKVLDSVISLRGIRGSRSECIRRIRYHAVERLDFKASATSHEVQYSLSQRTSTEVIVDQRWKSKISNTIRN